MLISINYRLTIFSNQSKLVKEPVSKNMDCGLRTTDYGLGIKHGLRYKTRTKHYGLGVKYGPRPNLNSLYWKNCFFPFSPSFSKAISRSAELPSLCNVVSSIYQLFVPHYGRIYVYLFNNELHYRMNRQMSFEFSSNLSTVDLSKHLIENSYSSSIL